MPATSGELHGKELGARHDGARRDTEPANGLVIPEVQREGAIAR
jgi:hypothetical protein